MGRRRLAAGLVLPLVLLVLLAVLAVLQYRWTGEISRAEAERMQASLRSSVRRFAGDVDEELIRLLRYFRVPRDGDVARTLEVSLQDYKAEAPFPDMVETIELMEDDSLESFAQGQRGKPKHPFDRRRDRRFPIPRFFDDPLAIAIPVRANPPGYILVTLNRATIQTSVLPRLVDRHFASDGELDYDLVILDRGREPIYESAGAERDRVVASPDARAELLSARGVMSRWRPPRGRRPDFPQPPPGALRQIDRELAAGRWTVYVQHREGSLEAAVGSVRARNLAISFGIMALLAGSVALIAVSTRRAAELTNRKMEFVAGVSHELRTPVAVVRSAGQNLADGSVSEPSQIRRYGAVIEAEGRRLNELVDQVLELAGIQSQRRRYQREPVSTGALTESVVADLQTQAEAAGVFGRRRAGGRCGGPWR